MFALASAINDRPFDGRTSPTTAEDMSDDDDAPTPWNTLPQDLFIHVAAQLVDDLPALARLAQTCLSASSGLAGVLKERELRWVPAFSGGCDIIKGQTIESRPGLLNAGASHLMPWAAGSALPQSSSSSGSRWGFRATNVKEHSWIGICAGEAGSAAPFYAWAIRLVPYHTLHLFRFDHDATSGLFHLGSSLPRPRCDYEADYAVACCKPDGWAYRVTDGSTKAGSEERGAIVDVIVDTAARSLSFRINDGPVLSGIRGFPAGLELRPWASSSAWGAGEHEGSSVTLSRRLMRL